MSLERITGGALENLPAPARDIWLAAATREVFRPGELLQSWIQWHEAASPEARESAVSASLDLSELSQESTDASGQAALRLTAASRREVLGAFGAGAARSAIESIPQEEMTPVEHAFALLLTGQDVQLNTDDRARLLALDRAMQWGEAVGAVSQSLRAEVERALKRNEFLGVLAGDDLSRFVGRGKFLARLDRIWRQGGQLSSVLVEGPGGIGKSSLIARFIADRLAMSEQPPDAVFHIDFDRPALQRARPSTIIREMARQALLWWTSGEQPALRDLARRPDTGDDAVEELSDQARSIEAAPGDGIEAASILMRAIGRGRDSRIILFVDSYERVDLIDDTAAVAPSIAAAHLNFVGFNTLVIFGSRSFSQPERLSRRKPMRLGVLQAAEASVYLQNEAGRLDIQLSPVNARRIMGAVGRSPLALRLAVGLLEKEPEFNFSSGDYRRFSDERIQAMLYDRFLLRIRDRELRKLAKPGLLLRRVSREIIDRVLREPCDISPEVSSENLMRQAQAEGQLFERVPEDPEVLSHRQDVRSLMLPDIEKTVPAALAHRINEAAVAYYETRSGTLQDRVEELYHRLRLGQNFNDLDLRWIDEAGPFLRMAMEDFPRNAKAYLRRKIQAASLRQLSAEVRAVDSVVERARFSDQAFVEMNTTELLDDRELEEIRSSAAAIFQSGAPDEELQNLLVRFNLDRIDGPVADVFAQGLVRQGRHDELLKMVSQASLNPSKPSRGNAVLTAMVAAIYEGRQALDTSLTYWQSSLLFLGVARFPAHLELAALIGCIRVRRKLSSGPKLREEQVSRALSLVSDIGHELNRRRVLAREVAAELADRIDRHDNPGNWPESDSRRLLGLLESVLGSGQAFPSAIRDQERLEALSVRLFGFSVSSAQSLGDMTAKLLYGHDDKLALLTACLREEVDWALRTAAYPRRDMAQAHDAFIQPVDDSLLNGELD